MARVYRRHSLIALLAVMALCTSHDGVIGADEPPGLTLQPTETNGNGAQTDAFPPEVTTSVTPDGALSAHIPLWVPPGRAGMQPNIALDYNSRWGLSSAGYGWQLSGLPVITRCVHSIADSVLQTPNHPRTVKFDGNDQLCLSGEPLIPDDTSQVNTEVGALYRTKHDRHAIYQITQADASGPLEITGNMSDGRLMVFGKTIESNRVDYTGSSLACTTQRYAWAVSRITDHSYNAMYINWQVSNDTQDCPPLVGLEYYPISISYTENLQTTNLPPTKTVQLSYQPQMDIDAHPGVATWAYGIPFSHEQRLYEIDMLATDPNLAAPIKVHQYLLNYETGNTCFLSGRPERMRPELVKVTECDGAVPSICKPPVTLDYGQGDCQPTDDQILNVQTQLTDVPPAIESASSLAIYTGDFNRDGRDDLVYKKDEDDPPIMAAFSNGTLSAPSLSDSVQTGLAYSPGWTLQTFDAAGTGYRNALMQQVVDEQAKLGTTLIPTSSPDITAVWYYSNLFSSIGGVTGYNLRVLDPDGDGRQDLLNHAWSSSAQSSATWQAQLQMSLGASTFSYGPPGPVLFADSGALQAIDMDGDGAHEALFRVAGQQSVRMYNYLDNAVTNSGWQLFWDPAIYPTFTQPSFVDINGDGLTDVVVLRISNNTLTAHVQFNTGKGLAPDIQFTPEKILNPDSEGNIYITNTGVMDWNNDGRQDIVVQDNTGALFALYLDGGPGPGMSMHTVSLPISNNNFGFAVLDVNGDGLDDIAVADTDSSGNGSIALAVRENPSAVTRNRRLQHIYRSGVPRYAGTTPGERIDINYAPITDPNVYTNDDTACQQLQFPQRCITGRIWVVSELVRTNDQATAQTPPANDTTFSYANGRGDMQGGGFLGFEKTFQTDAITGNTLETHYDLSPKGTIASFYLPGLPIYVRSTATFVDSDGNPSTHYDTTNYSYSIVWTDASSGNTGFAYASPVVHTVQEAPSGSLTTLELEVTQNAFDSFGNQTLQAVSRSDGSADSVTHSYSYTLSGFDAWPHPISETIVETSSDSASAGTLSRTRTLSYDNDSWLLTHETDLPNSNEHNYGEQTLDTQIDRGIGGLPQTITASGSSQARQITFTYDSLEQAFLASTTDAVGTTSFSYYQPLGILLQSVDPNGVSLTSKYDGFGRVVSSLHSSGDRVSYSYCPAAQSPAAATLSVDTTLAILENHDNGFDQRVVTELNWLEKPTRRVVFARADDKETYEYFDYSPYDGLLDRHIVPEFFLARGTAYEQLVYDNLRRPIQRHSLDGSTWTTGYKGFQVTTTNVDDNSPPLVEMHDSRGRVIASTETQQDASGVLTPSTTNYFYGPFGSLFQKVDAEGNAPTTFQYNRIGKLYHVQDPDTGSRYFHYDAFHEVLAVETPEYTTGITYDTLGRKLTETTGSRINSYTWDASQYGLGKISSITSPDGVKTSWAYNPGGQLEEKRLEVPAGSEGITVGFSYDDFGRLQTVTYPSPRPGSVDPQYAVTYSRGDYGDVVSLNDGSLAPIWQKQDSTATGQFYTALLGGEIQEQTFENSTHLGRLGEQKITDTGNHALLGDQQYDYDGRGNVVLKSDLVHNYTQTFNYDPMSRLRRWAWSQPGVGSTTYTYDYDQLGNLSVLNSYINNILALQKTYPRDTTLYGPHQIAWNPDYSAYYAYDGNGRQIFSDRLVQYNEWDLPTEFGAFQFWYDGNHSRVRRFDTSGNQRITFDDFYDRDDQGPTVTHYYKVYAPGNKLVAIHTQVEGGSSATIFTHSDQVDSIELGLQVVPGMGAVTAQDITYSPQGEAFVYSGPAIPVGFGGNEGDPGNNVYDFKNRIYDPYQMRFLTPDLLTGSNSSGQSWNPYSYVLNNPATLVDPLGLDPKEKLAGGVRMYDDPTGETIGGIEMVLPPADPVPDNSNSPAQTPSGGDGQGLVGNFPTLSVVVMGPVNSFGQSFGISGYVYSGLPFYNNAGNPTDQRNAAINALDAVVTGPFSLLGDTNAWGPKHDTPTQPRPSIGDEVIRYATFIGLAAVLGVLSEAAAELFDTHPTFRPGPYAGESIPARSTVQKFTTEERAAINQIGKDTGCHTCGTTNPGTKYGDFVPDHQPPTRLSPAGTPQRLYPQCIGCSREQGLAIARKLRGQ